MPAVKPCVTAVKITVVYARRQSCVYMFIPANIWDASEMGSQAMMECIGEHN